MKKKAQSIVEFVLVFPLMIILIYGVIEFGLYYRMTYVVQDIAEEAAAASSRELVSDSMTDNIMTSANFNQAAARAAYAVKKSGGVLAVANLTLNYTDMGATYGSRPYALYEFNSTATRTINGVSTPIVKLYFDYRHPFDNGIAVQLIYQYKTFFGGLSLPLPNGESISILPQNIAVISTRVQSYSTY